MFPRPFPSMAPVRAPRRAAGASALFAVALLVLASSRTVHRIPPAPVVGHQPGRSARDRQAVCPRFLPLPSPPAC